MSSKDANARIDFSLNRLDAGRAKTRLRKAYVATNFKACHAPKAGPRQSVATAGLGASRMCFAAGCTAPDLSHAVRMPSIKKSSQTRDFLVPYVETIPDPRRGSNPARTQQLQDGTPTARRDFRPTGRGRCGTSSQTYHLSLFTCSRRSPLPPLTSCGDDDSDNHKAGHDITDAGADTEGVEHGQQEDEEKTCAPQTGDVGFTAAHGSTSNHN